MTTTALRSQPAPPAGPRTVAATAIGDVPPPPVSALRRILAHPRLMHHNRLVAAVGATNLALLAYGLTAGWWSGPTRPTRCGSAALANVALAVLVRQQYVINLLFWLATRAPDATGRCGSAATLGKVYHFGGLHVGAALAGTAWFLAQLGALTVGDGPAGGAGHRVRRRRPAAGGRRAPRCHRCGPAGTTCSNASTGSAVGRSCCCSGCRPASWPAGRPRWPPPRRAACSRC